jgi:hypothetical protein
MSLMLIVLYECKSRVVVSATEIQVACHGFIKEGSASKVSSSLRQRRSAPSTANLNHAAFRKAGLIVALDVKMWLEMEGGCKESVEEESSSLSLNTDAGGECVLMEGRVMMVKRDDT